MTTDQADPPCTCSDLPVLAANHRHWHHGIKSMLPPAQLLWVCALFVLLIPGNYMQTWCHPKKTRIHDVSQRRQSTTEPRAIGNRHKKSDEDRTCSSGDMLVHRQTDTHTHTFNGPFSRTTWVGRYQKGKTKLDFTEARDSEWQWHRLGHMQVCTSFRQITMPAPHYSVFYRLDALPAAQPTASKHWRQLHRQTDIHINKQKYNTDILITTPHSLLAAEQQNTHSLKAFKKSTVCTSNETLTSDKQ